MLDALAPAAVHLAVRAVGVAVLAIMAGRDDTSVTTALRAWDGSWLLAIARYGYAGVPVDMLDAYGHHTAFTALGFFPGYPAVVAVVGVVTGGNLVAAGLLVSLVSGVVGAYGLTALGELVPGGSRRACYLAPSGFLSPIIAAISGRMFSRPFSWAWAAMRAPTAAMAAPVNSALWAPTQLIDASRLSLSCWKRGAT